MLSIVTTDRLGLLASIARVFVQYGINLVTARITTLGERAEDVFLIESFKLRDPVFCAEFEKAVLEALAAFSLRVPFGKPQNPPQRRVLL